MTLASRALVGAASLVLVAGLAACGGSADTASAPAPSAAAGAVDLSADCPATVVIQTDWNPEAEHGAQYALLGSDYTVDAKLKSVSGPLMSKGKSTGVNVEIRAGGPAIGFESVATQMYKDDKITLGYASTDGQIQTSKALPVKAVMAPLDINPQMIMWDPATYPNVKTIKELGATGAVVRVFGGASYMEYLVDSGQIDRKNVDEGYDGTPANFVAAQGKDAQQGFASAEPYIYQNEVKDWGKPVAFQLIHDAGWEIYAGTMSVKTADFEKLSPCLKKLVPVMQQAEVDYYSDPAATNKLILDLVDQYDTGWVYSQGVADFSVEQQKKLKLIGNGDNATIGDFDTERVQRILDVMGPIADKLGTPAAEGLTVDDLVTNEFIDTSIGLPPVSLEGLHAELLELLGPRGVSADRRVRERASVDGAKMSPIIVEQLPLGMADLVAFPTDAEQIAQVVGAAVRHGVAITPRGKGTGNYGQAIPMPGGLVLDLSRARAVIEVGDGVITAEAGASMVSLEQAARETGQELWMYPSTAQSSIGGFLGGGSGGTGSLVHGSNSMGFVAALDVVHAVPDATLVHVEEEEAQAYVHNYGVTGIIARATVRLDPVHDWHGFYASFDTFEDLLTVLRSIGGLTPTPRLVSGDLPTLANALPEDPAIPADRASLRAILDVATLEQATALVEGAGGRVEDVRPGPQPCVKISTLSYNHPIEWLQKTSPGRYFHLEVGGHALIDRLDEVHAVFEGGMLHIEAQYDGVPIGMLAGVYDNPQQVYDGIDALRALGVGVHSPHQWHVDFEVERTRALAARTDPQGLLNPGKLVTELAPGAGKTMGGRSTAGAS